MFACISLNPVYSLNNKCRKDQYLHWILKWYVKSAQVKVLCLLVYL